MTMMEVVHESTAKRKKFTRSTKGKKPKIGKATSVRADSSTADTSEELHSTRVTKHDRILTLLSRRDGATIPELMEASGWQQHSVRGFLAGTVKKKHGFALNSSKSQGELRRYRIETKRGR